MGTSSTRPSETATTTDPYAPKRDDGLYAYAITSATWGRQYTRIEWAPTLKDAKRDFGWTRQLHTTITVRRARISDMPPRRIDEGAVMADPDAYLPDIFDDVRHISTGEEGRVVGFGVLPDKRLWVQADRGAGEVIRGTSSDFTLIRRMGHRADVTGPTEARDGR
jgi:hypothetical protein